MGLSRFGWVGSVCLEGNPVLVYGFRRTGRCPVPIGRVSDPTNWNVAWEEQPKEGERAKEKEEGGLAMSGTHLPSC